MEFLMIYKVFCIWKTTYCFQVFIEADFRKQAKSSGSGVQGETWNCPGYSRKQVIVFPLVFSANEMSRKTQLCAGLWPARGSAAESLASGGKFKYA